MGGRFGGLGNLGCRLAAWGTGAPGELLAGGARGHRGRGAKPRSKRHGLEGRAGGRNKSGKGTLRSCQLNLEKAY